MVTVLVRADHPAGYRLQAAGRNYANALGKANGAHRTLVQARRLHFLVGQKLEALDHASGLKFVEVVIARHEEHGDYAILALAGKRFDR